MRTAIYGAGSLGTILGAYLAKSGMTVDLINRNTAHVQALKQNGARITGTVEFTQPVAALLPSEMQGIYDVVFLLTKQLENRQVVESLLPFLGEQSILCTMQNGLPEPLVASIAGTHRTMGCAIAWGATLVGPGVCELTSEPDSISFSLGVLPGGPTQRLQDISAILERMGRVVVEKNFIGARWSKLLVNSAFSGMATVCGCTFGEVCDNRHARRQAQRIIQECIDTAHENGVAIEPIQGKDIVRLFKYHGAIKQWISFQLIPLAMKKHRKLYPSMLQDIKQGKRCEIDAINGVVSSQGIAAGVPTPCNDTVVRLVHAIETGKLQSGFANLAEFPS